MEAVTQDLAPRETLIQMANQYWQEEMKKHERPATPEMDDEAVDEYV
jgi:hypothetical protein